MDFDESFLKWWGMDQVISFWCPKSVSVTRWQH